MKLNYRRTFLIGLAFMSISAFWQMYDGIIPVILRDTFKIGDTISGIIMAADNVLALFLLPLLGAVSDKVDTRIGKRMPFIMGGTAAAVLFMLFLPIIDNAYASTANEALKYIFIGVLMFVLLAMATYRSPAVALMPDLTPKPLRSKANAIINLMGTVGGALYLGLTAVMYSKSKIEGLEHIDYLPLFIIVAAVMVGAVALLFFTVKEKRDIKEVEEYDKENPEENIEADANGKTVLPKDVKKSLIFILVSISLWFMGYNAISTAFTKYATQEWSMALGDANFCLMLAVVVALIAFVPIGILSSKIGRKRTIMIGVAVLAVCLGIASVYGIAVGRYSPVLLVVFAFIGVAWAAINVNSFPMVVEMCKGSDIGKYTGLYYTFSMAAQIITPILSGYLLEHVGYWTLFPYSVVFFVLAFVTMSFVRHGDSKPLRQKA